MITRDHALSIAHAAASLAYQRLSGEKSGAHWYCGNRPNGRDASAIVVELGAFVERWPDAVPEALYRTAMASLKRAPEDYSGLAEPQRTAYDVFLSVAGLLYTRQKAAAKAAAEAEAARIEAERPPSSIRRRDTIFHQPSISDREL